MSTSFRSYVPASGKRQPRIVYDINDPRVAVIERLRDVFGYRSMNDAYLTALALGANTILQKEDPHLVVRKFVELKPGRKQGAKVQPGQRQPVAGDDQMVASAPAAATPLPATAFGGPSASAEKGPPEINPSLRGFASRGGALPAESIHRAESPAPTLQASPAGPAAGASRPAGSRLAAHHFDLYGGDDLDQ